MIPNTPLSFEEALKNALAARADDFEPRHEAAFRLFNGFYEGFPTLSADVYARTLVLHNYADSPTLVDDAVAEAAAFYQERLPWLRAVLIKSRHTSDDEARRGSLLEGEATDRFVCENGVWYGVNLTLNQDSSFYLDTRHLREWAKETLAGKSVLNTFAYTGSLGVAARAGGASRVVQLDLSRAFLNVAKASYTRNGFAIQKTDFRAGDFWPQVGHLKREGARFDCVFVDPPLFSRTRHGMVDLAAEGVRLLNKVRPLINDGGYLVSVNNALFLSGADYLASLEALCADGYLSIERLIPVPESFTGGGSAANLPADPAPFNHPTKMAILRVRRKDAGAAQERGEGL